MTRRRTALTLSAASLCAISGSALAGSFNVIGLPDTQNYSEFYPQIFAAQTQWIADNKNSQKIRFVSHYGDVVNHGDSDTEWANADAAMDVLDAANIRYGVASGNHDVTPSGGAGTAYIPEKFLSNFGPSRFAGKGWYGASPSGMSSFQLFNGGGRKFLSLHIAVDMPVEELAWAEGIMAKHRDKAVMMTTHRYLQDAEDYTGGVPIVPSGRYPDIWYSVEGTYHPQGIHVEEAFQSFVRQNKQIFLVNSGHFHEEYRQTSTNIYGDPVHEVLADYQDDPNGGNGFLRIMKFDTTSNKINVKSYSPYLNAFETKDESQFSLDVDWNRYTYTQPTLTFRNGVGNYNSARDTWLNEESPTANNGNADRLIVDDDVNNSIFSDRRGQGLLRFDNIFTQTGQSGRIPLGATITSATLRITLADDIDTPFFDPGFDLYMMTRDWSENSTWNSMNGGLSAGADYGAFVGAFAGDNSPDSDFLRIIDVTGALQAWSNGAPNFGFAILPQIISGNDDGIEVWSTEAANILYRPVLEVSYAMTVPAPGVAALALGVPALLRRRRA